MRRTITAAGLAGLICSGEVSFAHAFDLPAAPEKAQPAAPARAFRDPTNAALVYWPTFMSLAPETSQRFADAYQAMVQDQFARPDTETTRLLAAKQELIEQIMRASRIRDVDWGLEWSRGANAIIPHLGKLRLDARILGLDARRLIVEGDLNGAAERVAAMHRIASHAAPDGPLICALVGASISNSACTETEVLINDGRLTTRGKQAILEAMTWLDRPDPFRIRTALQGERAWTSDWIRRNCVGPEAGKTAAQMLSGLMEETPANKALRDSVEIMNETALHAELDKIDHFYAEAINAWNAADAAAKIKALDDDATKEKYGLFFSVLAPAVQKTFESDQRARGRFNDTRTRLSSYAPASSTDRRPAGENKPTE